MSAEKVEEGMTDPDSAVPQEVRRLAEASEEILRWIERLKDRALEARPEVVERIRRDYQVRLRSADTRLAAQRPLLVEIVSEREALQESLRAEMGAHASHLEEIELRHEVGEFSEAELKARRAPIERELADLGMRIEREKEMIAMLSGVIERTTAPEAEPAIDTEPVIEAEAEVHAAAEVDRASEVDPELEVDPEAVADEDEGEPPSDAAGAGSEFADELDFLESLSLGETGPFDAVSAMLDEEERSDEGPN